MTSYAVATGWDNVDNLQVLDPQPARKVPLQHAEITYGGLGDSAPNGYLSTRVSWSVADREQYGSILSQHGLSLAVTSARMTVRIPLDDDATEWVRANVIVEYRQDASRDMAFWRGLELTYNRIEIIED